MLLTSARCFAATSIGTFAAAIFVALAGCGGGGAGSNAGPPTAAPSPSPTITGAPFTPAPNVALSGRVVDESGNGVANATVSFGTGFTLVPGGAITGVVATTTTNASGAFAAMITRGSASFVEVDAAGRAAAHKAISTSADTALAAWTLPAPTSDELAGLAALNSDRASAGTGPGAQPLTWDADMLLIARYRTQHMAALGFFDHVAPGASVADAGARWQSIANSLYVPAEPHGVRSRKHWIWSLKHCRG